MKAVIYKIKESQLLFYIFLGGTLFSFVFYMYCINSAVRSGVVINKADNQIANLESTLSDLESAYVANMNSITLETAKALGYSEPTNKIFISKDSGKSLTFLSNH